jgi:hypothetical protein
VQVQPGVSRIGCSPTTYLCTGSWGGGGALRGNIGGGGDSEGGVREGISPVIARSPAGSQIDPVTEVRK